MINIPAKEVFCRIRPGRGAFPAEFGIQTLLDAGYITGIEATTAGGFNYLDIRLLPSGRQILRQWLKGNEIGGAEDTPEKEFLGHAMTKIFISYVHEEAAFVVVLKGWIETTFPDRCEVFFSSDQDDIPPGAKWLDRIDQAITESGIWIAICSPTSIARPWINFEIGCAWIKEIPIIPICHSGLTKSTLPQPIATFQALDFSSDFPEEIITAIAEYLEVSKIPRISFSEMYSELQDALSSCDKIPSEEKVDASPLIQDLQDEEIEILKLLAKEGQSLPLMAISGPLHIDPTKAEYFLNHLDDIDYIFHTIVIDSPTSYSLNKHGLAYLVVKDLV